MGEVRETVIVTKCPPAYCAPTQGGFISDVDRALIRDHDNKIEAVIAAQVRAHRYHTTLFTAQKRTPPSAEELENLNG